MPEAERKVGREARIDVLGYCRDLVDAIEVWYGKDFKDAVKKSMAKRGIDVGEGDFYTGLLFGGGGVGSVDPVKFVKRCLARGISQKQTLGAMSITKKAAAELGFSEEDIEAMCVDREADPTKKSLRLSHKDGARPTLSQVLERVTEAMKPATKAA